MDNGRNLIFEILYLSDCIRVASVRKIIHRKADDSGGKNPLAALSDIRFLF